MIKIKATDNKIVITGHAGYDLVGKDIVCSSVSSIVITTINGILKLEDTITYSIDDDGLTIKVVKPTNVNKTLISNMLDLLHQLASDYPDNIKFIK
jgi:uncharacterized protein YsxB (DUF464 family)